ncbi:MAG: Serine phosphatase RsbU, regulator of sigma subunit [uncultured Acidimicrobiales bacterium]|uniref:histidine kinase n=1 Tax=uncultured Acidimicrobiales bacterium TaxID=310071 RepID=A0A6J4IEC9_9ACTN|nr:MAG: Serine phosphatase RsbU, regulator of sigma subunit [uncultured Acidimicrobiales bacterium]
MATVAELARLHTGLSYAQVGHLQRLVASWGPLADLCFADLLLLVPDTSLLPHGRRFVVFGQIRPTTNQTLYRSDFVGAVFDEAERPLVGRAMRGGRIVEGEMNLSVLHERVSVLAIPVRLEGEVVGVVTRESAPTIGRQPGELEAMYVEVFNRFARMITTGEFPFGAEDASEEAPRVGDGAVVLDRDGRVEYASPNAVSALHRIGVHANAEGMKLSELGLDEVAVRTSFAIGAPVTEEIERGPEVTVLVRCLPMLDEGTVTGALVLMRDISELRRRDRLLISMDATIREIHHRVKNNLQTISSLLRLQGRRLESPEAKGAIEESVRRIRAIALVHETLSREVGDELPFSEIVRPLVRMVEEGLLSPEHPITIAVEGDAGKLPARIATPLAVVLNELLQNTVDHAFPPSRAADGGRVVVTLSNDGTQLVLRVVDDGVGLPEGFSIDQSRGLGLSIVRSLVTSQIEGSIVMRGRSDGSGPTAGTEIEITVPLIGGAG